MTLSTLFSSSSAQCIANQRILNIDRGEAAYLFRGWVMSRVYERGHPVNLVVNKGYLHREKA